jgi:type II secretory pathway component GspD/PulD (secretin)
MMMRIFCLLLLLLLFPRAASSETVSIRFNDVPLPVFTSVVLTDIDPQSFIMHHDFLISTDRITVNIEEVESASMLEHLRRILETRFFTMRKIDDVYYISRLNDKKEFFIYRPHFRSADYLRELSGAMIRKSGFSGVYSVEAAGESFQGHNDGVSALISRDLDAVVYYGTFLEIQQLKRLLVDLDKPSGEVLVRAVIYEVRKTSDENNAVSVALGLLESAKGLGVRVELGTAADLSGAVRIQSGNVNAVWSVLSSDSRFTVVSAPTMRIRSGNKARFMAGQEVPTLGNVTHNGNQSVQSVEYRSSGVILELQPEVRADVVDLTITQQLSSFMTTNTGVNDSPTLLKRELQTSVTVSNDDVIVLGGLDERSESSGREGFSFLPDFFRGTHSDGSQTEILLMLHVQRIEDGAPR